MRMEPNDKDVREANRRSWNEATRAHNSHKGDQAQFFREGGTTVRPEEIELLGDLRGLRLVHLLCNSGQDTLSLTRLGATVTGVDISDEAIAFASRLSAESGITATFERGDVFEWLTDAARHGRQFDVVYSSYGAVHWISDLDVWADGIARVIAPGGYFVLVDFHPIERLFDREWNHVGSYFPPADSGRANTLTEGVIDYIARTPGRLTPFDYQPGVEHFQNPQPAHTFSWGLGEIVTAVAGAGLRLEVLREYPHTIAHRFGRMREIDHYRTLPPADLPSVPLLYGLRACKA
jgi:SAM-dependent methyltransferase